MVRPWTVIIANDSPPTILIHSYEWLKNHETELTNWLKSENLLSSNTNFNEYMDIFLNTEKQLVYFKMRWG